VEGVEFIGLTGELDRSPVFFFVISNSAIEE
jgi:hypothetical protein